jgi:hypothetical protein
VEFDILPAKKGMGGKDMKDLVTQDKSKLNVRVSKVVSGSGGGNFNLSTDAKRDLSAFEQSLLKEAFEAGYVTGGREIIDDLYRHGCIVAGAKINVALNR